MKRIILVLSLVLGINMIYAQTSKEIKFDQYAKKIEKSDAEISFVLGCKYFCKVVYRVIFG